MNIYTITALALVILAILTPIAIRIIARRLPKRETGLVNIRDRHGNIVGLERREL